MPTLTLHNSYATNSVIKKISLRDELIGLALVSLSFILLMIAWYYNANAMRDMQYEECMKDCEFDNMFLKQECKC